MAAAAVEATPNFTEMMKNLMTSFQSLREKEITETEEQRKSEMADRIKNMAFSDCQKSANLAKDPIVDDSYKCRECECTWSIDKTVTTPGPNFNRPYRVCQNCSKGFQWTDGEPLSRTATTWKQPMRFASSRPRATNFPAHSGTTNKEVFQRQHGYSQPSSPQKDATASRLAKIEEIMCEVNDTLVESSRQQHALEGKISGLIAYCKALAEERAAIVQANFPERDDTPIAKRPRVIMDE